jgi:DNA-binding MarR family transcriptional regulator
MVVVCVEFEASDEYAGPADARARSLEDERLATVTITDTGRALLAKVLPGHIEVLNQLLFELLSR